MIYRGEHDVLVEWDRDSHKDIRLQHFGVSCFSNTFQVHSFTGSLIHSCHRWLWPDHRDVFGATIYVTESVFSFWSKNPVQHKIHVRWLRSGPMIFWEVCFQDDYFVRGFHKRGSDRSLTGFWWLSIVLFVNHSLVTGRHSLYFLGYAFPRRHHQTPVHSACQLHELHFRRSGTWHWVHRSHRPVCPQLPSRDARGVSVNCRVGQLAWNVECHSGCQTTWLGSII